MQWRTEEKLKRSSDVPIELPSPKKTKSKVNATVSRMEPECIISSEEIEGKSLHKASSYIYRKCMMWASKTRNAKLMATLATAADVHAMDAFYHRSCYITLKNAASVMIQLSLSCFVSVYSLFFIIFLILFSVIIILSYILPVSMHSCSLVTVRFLVICV